MRSTTVRILAAIILALLGAPVALHVVFHDLHGHKGGTASAGVDLGEHGSHEHPVIASAAPEAVPPTDALCSVVVADAPSITFQRVGAVRNVIAHGAARIDDDVGVQSLLSSFLI